MQTCSLPELRHLLSLDTGTPCFQDFGLGLGLRGLVLRTSVWTGALSLGFLGHQLADSMSWGYSASIIMTPFLIISLSIFILIVIIVFTKGQNPDRFTNVNLYCFVFSDFTRAERPEES